MQSGELYLYKGRPGVHMSNQSIQEKKLVIYNLFLFLTRKSAITHISINARVHERPDYTQDKALSAYYEPLRQEYNYIDANQIRTRSI